MKRKLKAHARYRNAQNNQTVICVGGTYLTGDLSTLTEIQVISPDGSIVGHITLGHLVRLGNANWALSHPSMGRKPEKVKEIMAATFPGSEKHW